MELTGSGKPGQALSGPVSVRFSPACIGAPEVKTIKRAVELRTLRPPARLSEP